MAAKKYLVPLDFSQIGLKALRYGAQLAKSRRDSSLLVLHVITEPPTGVPFYLRKKFYAEIEELARKRIKEVLQRKSFRHVKSAIRVVRGADAAAEIAREAKKVRATMIVMGSHGRTGIKRLIMGSVAEKIVGAAPCPVLIIK